MQYKHIIWDWNGTLIDDVSMCVRVVGKLMARRGLGPLTVEHYQQEVDFPIVDFYQRLGFDFTKESYEDLAGVYIEAYLAGLPGCNLRPGAVETLRKIQQAGLSQSVLSAYNHDLLVQAVESFGLTRYFSELVGLDDFYAHSKVDNGKKWIGQSNFSREEILFVGDMLHDFDVASQMGVEVVLLCDGHQSRDKLIATGARVLQDLAELSDFLGI